MEKFIKYEQWKGHWYLRPSKKVDYSTFEVLDYCSWFKKEKREIETRIETLANIIEPSRQQTKTLKFILEEQNKILSSVFDYYQKIIFPIYNNATDIEENEIVHSKSELNKVFGIKRVEIPRIAEQKSIYYLIQFDFKYDDEHGFYMLFENSSAIDFFGEGDKNYDTIDIYKSGLTNKNGKPLAFSLSQLNGQLVFDGNFFFDEEIKFSLKKGTYRIFISCNQRKFHINFYVPNHLEKFSLRQIVTMK